MFPCCCGLTFIKHCSNVNWNHNKFFTCYCFCKYWVKAPTKEFTVSACCSWTLLKFSINAVISLRCSSIPEKAAFPCTLLDHFPPPELSFCSVSFVFSSLSYYLLLQQSPLRCFPSLASSTEVPPELEPAWAKRRSVTPSLQPKTWSISS